MKHLLLFIHIFLLHCSFAQEETDPKDSTLLFVNCPAQFPGEKNALINYLSENIDSLSFIDGKEPLGRVYILFNVEVDGSISNIRVQDRDKNSVIMDGSTPFQNIPNWIPACDEEGNRVRDNVVIPLTICYQ